MNFTSVFDLIFNSMSRIVQTLQTVVFTYGNISVSLWDLMLGFLLTSAVCTVAFPWFGGDNDE